MYPTFTTWPLSLTLCTPLFPSLIFLAITHSYLKASRFSTFHKSYPTHLHLIPYKLTHQCIVSIPTSYTSIKTQYFNSPIVSTTKKFSTRVSSIFLVLTSIPTHSQPLPSRPTKTSTTFFLPLSSSSPGDKLSAAKWYTRTQKNLGYYTRDMLKTSKTQFSLQIQY